jgi:hypothetical protein
MRPSAFLIAILSAFLCGLSFGAERPNIVFILADDMGWRDPACFGGKAVPTPHMDALAAFRPQDGALLLLQRRRRLRRGQTLCAVFGLP